MKTKFMLLLTVLFVSATAMAQQITVTGTISDGTDLLPGVSVLVRGSSIGTESDFDGNYSIQAKKGDVLLFSFVGLLTKEVRVEDSEVINVTLEADNLLDEVIVTAYGSTTKKAFTGSASVIGSKELENRIVTSPLAAVEGNATGVQFISASGQPGSSPSIIIRGVGTLNGSTDPLYIVDGIQFDGDLSSINQDDIESFTVLKDAASTSLYGSRAANGVVIITTKRGTKGSIVSSASVSAGLITRAISDYAEVSPGQYYETMWEALRNTRAAGGDPAYASSNIYRNLGYNPFNVANDQIVGLDGKLNPNADVVYKSLNWYDEMEQTGMRTNYSFNVAGGGDNHKVFFSAAYLDEEGYLKTTEFDRLTTRLNADLDVNDRITVGGSANIALSTSSGPTSAGTSSIVNPFGFAKNIGSIYPVYVNDQNGNLVLDAAGNPIYDSGEGYSEYNIGSRPIYQGRHALQELMLNDERTNDNTYGLRFYGDIEILDGLNFKVSYGRDIQEILDKEYENNIIGDAQPTGRYGETRARRDIENFNQILYFNKSIADVHNIDLTMGHESFARTFMGSNATSIKQVVEGIYEFDNFSEPVSLNGSTTQYNLEGYFVRANYNFDDKYFVSGSFRRDGSSIFTNNRWGNFFSIGGSWRITEESFMNDVSWIDNLKLRASYGQVGNDQLGDYFLSQPRYSLTSNATIPAIYWSDIGNADLQWETMTNFDVALEFGLFKSRLEGTFEYYSKASSDMLYYLPIPISNGLNEYPANTGDMYNSGIELSLTGHVFNRPDFNWDITVNNSTFSNEITSLPDPFVNGSKRWEEGRSRYDFYLLHTAEVDANTGDQLFYMYELDEQGNSVPVYENGVHLTTNDWEDTERAYTGDSSLPDLVGSISNSFRYKGFNLNVLTTYSVGGKVLDNGYSAMMHSGTYGSSLHPDILNAWRKPGDITDVPRMQNGSVDLVRSQSTRFLADASYWALKNVNFGYTFDQKVTEKLGMSNLRFSVSGENLFIKTAREGMNPQFNLAGTGSGNDYSPSRVVSFNLNLSL